MTGNIDNQIDCIIIGAGISGLMAARTLSERGVRVRVLDKGRGVGGRIATRRVDGHRFDHGAQSFFFADSSLQVLVREWQQMDLVRRCEYPFAREAFSNGLGPLCGNGGINTVMKMLAADLDVQVNWRVSRLTRSGAFWTVFDRDQRSFTARSVILTPPLPQAVDLIRASNINLAPNINSELKAVAYEPCIALLATYLDQRPLPNSAFIQPDCGSVALIFDNHAKGVSPIPGAVTIHSTAKFAREHWDQSDELIATELLRAISHYLPRQPKSVQVHRWRYSRCIYSHPESHLLVETPGPLALAGDGFAGVDIQGAALSGIAAARSVAAKL